MDFSKTTLHQRTRSGYDKLYKEYNEKKKAERVSSGGGAGVRSSRGSGRIDCIGSGKSNEGLRGSDGRRDESDVGTGKNREGLKGKEEFGKVLEKVKNVSEINVIEESDDTDDDVVGLNDCSGSGKVEKKLQKGNLLKRGKNVGQNSLIDESDDDDSDESDDDDDAELSKSSRRNQIKFDGEGVSGKRVCLGRKRRSCQKLKNSKGVGTNDSQKTSDDDDALSYLVDDNHKKSEKGFVNNITGENFDRNTSVSSHGGFLDESDDDDDGVTYLGDNITCLDDCAPSHSSRVESNEVKTGAVELDSTQTGNGDHFSLGLKSSEEDDNDNVNVNDEDDDYPGDEDLILISSSDCEDSEEEDRIAMKDGNVKEGTRSTSWSWTEVIEESTLDEGEEDKDDDGHGKKNDKETVTEPRLSKKRCYGDFGNNKWQNAQSGLKKMRTDQSPAKNLQSHRPPLCKSKKMRPSWVEDYGNGYCSSRDDIDGRGVKNFERIIDEKGTKNAGKTARKHDQFVNKIDVIKILTDMVSEDGDGDELLKKYVGPLEETSEEETPLEEAPVGRVLPYKFRFEDEDDMMPEEPETEIEMDELFTEMNMCLQVSEIGSSSGASVVHHDDVDFLGGKTDQATRCRQGKHQITINDQFGIICRCCSYVEMEIRDFLPPLSKNGRGGHDRYDYDKPDGPKYSDLKWSDCHQEGLHDPKMTKFEKGTVWDFLPGVRETMYPHQRDGFEFIWNKIAGGIYIQKLEKRLPSGGSGCIITHAPGTGKSRLTIVFLQAFMRMYPKARPVIIAPRSMLLTWEEEFKKWDVDIPFYILNGKEFSGKESTGTAKLLKKVGKGKSVQFLRLLKLNFWKKKPSILGITYRLFENLAGEEGKRQKGVNNPDDEKIKRILLEVPSILVLDEGHTPRNDQSLMWKALLNVKTKRSIILSGTPFQNNFDELYNTLCLVNPLLSYGLTDIFTKKRGRKNNASRGQWDSITSSIRKSQHKIHELRAMIDPFVHVHKGTILQEKLPGLRVAAVYLKPTKLQQKLLQSMVGSKARLENDCLMSLITVHPSLVSRNLKDNEQFRKVLKIYKKDPHVGVKTHFLLELIKLSNSLNEKVLVFSQYIDPLGFIKNMLKTKYKWVEGRDFLYMDGKQEEKHRQSSINTLNDPKSAVKVLLASIKACSEGINLVGASRVVLLDIHWNPSVESQAISRAYRLGQKKLVHVYHLVSGILEAEKFSRQVEKSHLSELVFSSKNKDGLNPTILPTVSKDKILEEMVQHEKLQDIFEKVIYQPKESNLFHTFG